MGPERSIRGLHVPVSRLGHLCGPQTPAIRLSSQRRVEPKGTRRAMGDPVERGQTVVPTSAPIADVNAIAAAPHRRCEESLVAWSLRRGGRQGLLSARAPGPLPPRTPELAVRRACGNRDQRQARTRREERRRHPRGLQRSGQPLLGQAELVAGMSAERAGAATRPAVGCTGSEIGAERRRDRRCQPDSESDRLVVHTHDAPEAATGGR
jgi:hypothetical protein